MRLYNSEYVFEWKFGRISSTLKFVISYEMCTTVQGAWNSNNYDKIRAHLYRQATNSYLKVSSFVTQFLPASMLMFNPHSHATTFPTMGVPIALLSFGHQQCEDKQPDAGINWWRGIACTVNKSSSSMTVLYGCYLLFVSYLTHPPTLPLRSPFPCWPWLVFKKWWGNTSLVDTLDLHIFMGVDMKGMNCVPETKDRPQSEKWAMTSPRSEMY